MKLLTLLLGAALSCGQNVPSLPGPALASQGFDYTDPAGAGFRLIKNPASTTTRLVLDLVGPAGLKTRGVGFNLQAGAGVSFGVFINGLPINDLGVYQLTAFGSVARGEPVALIGGVKPGNLLSVGIYQKDRDQGAKESGVPLCQIALLFDASARPAPGSAISLSVPKARVIPEEIGSVGDDPYFLDLKMRMADVAIAVGTLRVN